MKLNRYLSNEEITRIRRYADIKNLNLENIGYQYIDKSKLSLYEEGAALYIHKLLKEVIAGFSEFNNFKNNGKTIRFQYDWGYNDTGHHFIGVGYISLRELERGFTK